MEVVKKNIFGIVCGVIALLAVVSIFFPMGGMFDQLRAKVDGSRQMHQDITTLISKERTAPSINFLKPEEKPPLEMFPTKAVIAEGEKVVAEVKGQADKLLKQALDMNARRPLTNRALPSGRGADLLEFKRAYYGQMQQFIQDMNATVPPTPSEVELAAQRLRLEWDKRIQKDAQDRAVNQAEVDAAYESERQQLPERMKTEKATKATMYIAGVLELEGNENLRGGQASTPAMDYHPGIPSPNTNVFPHIVDVWVAQLSLWIQDDIVRAIRETNTVMGPNQKPTMPTVANASVKQLVRIVIPKEYIQPKGPPHLNIEQAKTADPSTGTTAAPVPEPIADDGSSPAPTDASALKAVGASATARASNPIYDVMHFHVTVDIEADKVPIFLDNLTKQRFNTVLSTNIRAVDLDRAFKAGYVYGNRPVVRLDVKGETIFFRDWTKNLMPQAVKSHIGLVEAKPAVAAN